MMRYGIAPGETVGPTVNMWDEMRKFLDMGSTDNMKQTNSTYGAVKMTENPVEPWNTQVKYLKCPPRAVTCI